MKMVGLNGNVGAYFLRHLKRDYQNKHYLLPTANGFIPEE